MFPRSQQQGLSRVALLLGSLAVAAWLYYDLHGRIGTSEDNLVPARLAARGEKIPVLVQCRQDPLRIQPIPGLEKTVREEDLVTVLCNALPWWNPPCVPTAFHELKLWGRHAVFTKDMFGVERSGDFLIKTLLSDKLCRANTVSVGGAYLLDSPFGIRPSLVGTDDAIEYRAEAHFGQLLMVLGEVGVPACTPVSTASGRIGPIRDMYQDALMRFSLSQELEFIACALAYWHPPQKTWQDQFGNQYDFDQLLSQLLATPLGKGSCGGTHVPYAVTTILRADDQYPLLSPGVRQRARNWLRALAHRLEYCATASGAWDTSWSEAAQANRLWGDDLLDRITITGHHLEWIALAPTDLRPSQRAVKHAVRALRSDVQALPPLPSRSFKALLPVSHGARALALLRGEDPFSAWLTYWKAARLRRTEKGFEVKGPGK
jgi:hypothetical protein